MPASRRTPSRALNVTLPYFRGVFVHEDSPDKYTVVENVKTQRGARTMALDPKTHRAYLVTAEFGPLFDAYGLHLLQAGAGGVGLRGSKPLGVPDQEDAGGRSDQRQPLVAPGNHLNGRGLQCRGHHALTVGKAVLRAKPQSNGGRLAGLCRPAGL